VRRAGRFFVLLALSIGLAAGALAGCLILLVPAVSPLAHATETGEPPPLVLAPLDQRSVILDSQGNVLQQLYSNEDRAPITLKNVPTHVINAVLDTEDRNFFEHGGVDYKGILRALVEDVKAGGVAQGGSTITQQLVKNTLFASQGGRKRTARDKLREATLAVQLEKHYTKNQILERYLNTVYFGRAAYGLQAAAERYFNKPVRQLDIPQSALLAGMIQAPGDYDPIDHPQAALRRRHEVLHFMEVQGHLTAPEVARYDQVPLPKKVYTSYSQIAPQSFFVDAATNWLLNSNSAASKALGATEAEREDRLYHGGLKITTTLDPTMQQEANDAVANGGLPQAAPNTPGGPIQAGMVVLDNATGAVRAIYGGPDFATSKFDLATDGKFQPGSSFKTYTLAAALEAGYSPNDDVNGSASCSFRPPLATADPYDVHADGGGIMTLRNAITHSINCAFVRLIISLGAGAPDQQRATAGPARVVEMAHRLGVTTDLPAFTSLTLGTKPVPPIDMAAAYSTIASDGLRKDPVYVTKIVGPDNTVIYDAPGSPTRQVLSPQVARTVTDMLKDVIKQGTATRANIDRPAAGKTGTTDQSTSVWFVGYTPQLTTAVAIGKPSCGNADDPVCSLDVNVAGRYTGGYGLSSSDAFGGHVAAGIWAAFMRQALANQPPLDFPPPDPTLWPDPRYFDENGRRFESFQPAPSPTTVGPSPTSTPTGSPTPTSPSPTSPPASTPPKTTPTTSKH
jgi:penicillin-binding protein 1A